MRGGSVQRPNASVARSTHERAEPRTGAVCALLAAFLLAAPAAADESADLAASAIATCLEGREDANTIADRLVRGGWADATTPRMSAMQTRGLRAPDGRLGVSLRTNQLPDLDVVNCDIDAYVGDPQAVAAAIAMQLNVAFEDGGTANGGPMLMHMSGSKDPVSMLSIAVGVAPPRAIPAKDNRMATTVRIAFGPPVTPTN